MKISQRLFSGFAVICLFVVFSGIMGVVYTNSVNKKLNFVAEVTTPAVELMDDMIISFWKNNNAMRVFSQEYRPEKLDKLREKFDRFNTEFDESELKIEKLISDQQILDNIETATKRHREFNNKAIEMMNTRISEMNARSPEEKSDMKQRKLDLVVELESITEEAVAVLDEIADKVEQMNIQADTESFTAVRNIQIIIVVTTIISIISAIIIGLILSQSMVKPINDLADAASLVSGGNFNIEIKPKENIDELNRLTETFNQMTKSLKSMVEESPRMRKFLKIRPEAMRHEFEIESHKSYLIKEPHARRSYEMLLEKVAQGYNGICITRTNPAELREKYEMDRTEIMWLSDVKDSSIITITDLNVLYKKLAEFITKSLRSVILIDRLDYIATKYGFEEMMKLIMRLNDKIAMSNAILLLSTDPATLGQRELSTLEKELREIPLSAVSAVPDELLKILAFISNQKRLNRETTFKDIGKEFNITAPTIQKKILELEKRGLVHIVKKGRNKLLELTKDSQSLVPA